MSSSLRIDQLEGASFDLHVSNHIIMFMEVMLLRHVTSLDTIDFIWHTCLARDRGVFRPGTHDMMASSVLVGQHAFVEAFVDEDWPVVDEDWPVMSTYLGAWIDANGVTNYNICPACEVRIY